MKQSWNQGGSSAPVVSMHTLRQGLFASLALMLTLIGAQQYHAWNQPAEPLIHTLHSMHMPAFHAVSAPASQANRLQTVEQNDQFQLPTETRWVF